MKYHSLKALYYQDRLNFEENYQARINNPTAVKLGLFVHPFNKHKEVTERQAYEMFYLPVNELLVRSQQVIENSKKISEIRLALPPLAEKQLFLTNLVKELQSTNEIEGVRSTRKEISEVTRQILKKEYKDQRFEGLVKRYLKLEQGKPIELEQVADFRKIWDQLLSETEVADKPYGTYFRKEEVYIMDGQKAVHSGDETETQIIADLQSLIKLLNDPELPNLYKYLAGHYFYEYIHPFYDGNGRTGRYILCSYLAQVLDPLSAITFSSSIAARKASYYKAFSEMSDPHNRAEATGFILTMLKLLETGQADLLEAMEQDQVLLKRAQSLLHNYDLKLEDQDILFIYCQQSIFGSEYDHFTDSELTEIVAKSRYKVNQSLALLTDRGLLKKVQQSPSKHILSNKLLDQIYQA